MTEKCTHNFLIQEIVGGTDEHPMTSYSLKRINYCPCCREPLNWNTVEDLTDIIYQITPEDKKPI